MLRRDQMKWKNVFVVILSFLFLMGFFSGICQAKDPKYGGTLVMSHHDPKVLNPIMEWGFKAFSRMCFNGLIDFTPTSF